MATQKRCIYSKYNDGFGNGVILTFLCWVIEEAVIASLVMNNDVLHQGFAFLAKAGLNLRAILDCATLPKEVGEMMTSSGIPLTAYTRLVLIGHGGRHMWDAIQEWGWETADPIDHYSMKVTQQFIHDYLGDPSVFWLYPQTPYVVPLQRLGSLAEWSHPSPLGLGISPVYGVWFAYRAAFLTTLDLPVVVDSPAASPCTTCAERPCIQTCPVGAVNEQAFNVEACAHFRLRDASPCAARCLSRLSCPFFAEHRYTPEQIRYHYDQSWKTLKAYYG